MNIEIYKHLTNGYVLMDTDSATGILVYTDDDGSNLVMNVSEKIFRDMFFSKCNEFPLCHIGMIPVKYLVAMRTNNTRFI